MFLIFAKKTCCLEKTTFVPFLRCVKCLTFKQQSKRTHCSYHSVLFSRINNEFCVYLGTSYLLINHRLPKIQSCPNTSKNPKTKPNSLNHRKYDAVQTLSTATRPFSILFKIYVTCLSLLVAAKSENAK